jgi:hypothetical protein
MALLAGLGQRMAEAGEKADWCYWVRELGHRQRQPDGWDGGGGGDRELD